MGEDHKSEADLGVTRTEVDRTVPDLPDATGKAGDEERRVRPTVLVGLGAAAMFGIRAGISALMQDPLQPVLDDHNRSILDEQKQVSPDQLALEISKNPDLQLRWKAMREYVQEVDKKVGADLEHQSRWAKGEAARWEEHSGIDPKNRSGAR